MLAQPGECEYDFFGNILFDDDSGNEFVGNIAETVNQVACFASSCSNFKYNVERLSWDEHCEKLEHHDYFNQRYGASLDAFDKLIRILQLLVTAN